MSIAICSLKKKKRNDLKAFPKLELEQINLNMRIKILTSFSEVSLSLPLFVFFVSATTIQSTVEALSMEVSDTKKKRKNRSI